MVNHWLNMVTLAAMLNKRHVKMHMKMILRFQLDQTASAGVRWHDASMSKTKL
jgi:hypothetical protein